MAATLASGDGEKDIFNFGSILSRLTDTATTAVEQVAPVWLERELEIESKVPVDFAPTYRNNDPQRQPPQGLTTTGTPTGTAVFSQGTMIALGVGLLAVLLFMKGD